MSDTGDDFNRGDERRLLAAWLDRVSWDELPEGIPEVKYEDD